MIWAKDELWKSNHQLQRAIVLCVATCHTEPCSGKHDRLLKEAVYGDHVFRLVFTHPRLKRFVTMPFYTDDNERMLHENFIPLNDASQQKWFAETFGVTVKSKSMPHSYLYQAVWEAFLRGDDTMMKKILLEGP